MGLTLSEETSNRVSEVVLPPRLGRNEACHCGSGIKYKRCCREQDEVLRRQLRGAVLPAWLDDSRSKLRQFEKYVCNVFDLPGLLASLVDTRRAPKIPTFDVVNSLFHTAVLRIPSINALEGDLKEEDFQKLIGRHPTPDVKAFSADVVANVLDQLHLEGLHGAVQDVIHNAERNKAFRDGSYSALRCVAMHGWGHDIAVVILMHFFEVTRAALHFDLADQAVWAMPIIGGKHSPSGRSRDGARSTTTLT